MRRILVTGATGFVGSHLLYELADSETKLFAVRRSRQPLRYAKLHRDTVTYVYNDGTFDSAYQIVSDVQPDTVFHLAAWCGDANTPTDSERLIEANFVVGAQWLDALRRWGGRCAFVNAGSFWQFGSADKALPNTLYAAAKQTFQSLLAW